jgi:hypothetical protein
MERLIGAAITWNGKMYVAESHSDAYYKAREDCCEDADKMKALIEAWVSEQIIKQFLTTNGELVNRGAAMSIAKKSGQIFEQYAGQFSLQSDMIKEWAKLEEVKSEG